MKKSVVGMMKPSNIINRQAQSESVKARPNASGANASEQNEEGRPTTVKKQPSSKLPAGVKQRSDSKESNKSR